MSKDNSEWDWKRGEEVWVYLGEAAYRAVVIDCRLVATYYDGDIDSVRFVHPSRVSGTLKEAVKKMIDSAHSDIELWGINSGSMREAAVSATILIGNMEDKDQ